jgi:hypothetical protein
VTPDSDSIADNPFSTRYTRPGAIPFRFPPGSGAGELVEQLRSQGWRGAIVGPHGSGKSSLVAALVPAIRRAGKEVLLVELHDGQRRLPVDLEKGSGVFVRPGDPAAEVIDQTKTPDPFSGSVVIVDGYEQLSWWNRLRLRRVSQRRGLGLLVTSHAPTALPLLFRTATSLGLAQAIVQSLLAGRPELITPERLAQRFESRQGDLRELLFDLYDLYEERRPPDTNGG